MGGAAWCGGTSLLGSLAAPEGRALSCVCVGVVVEGTQVEWAGWRGRGQGHGVSGEVEVEEAGIWPVGNELPSAPR